MRRADIRKRSTSLPIELALGAGFFAIGIAVLVARDAPQTGYESSIYTNTPIVTWGLLIGTLVVATVAIAWPTRERTTALATALGGTAMTAVVSVPIVRGYHFMGSADPLTHLGWTKDIANDVIDPHILFYPGYHSISYALGRVAGIELELALLVVTVVLFVAFLVFVPLTVKVLTGSTQAMGYAAIAAWLVLPINNVATHMMPHTNSLTLFYVPLVLFVAVLYLRSSSGTGPIRRWLTPTGVALSLVSLGLIMLHVQHATNVLLLFVGVCAIQFVYRRWKPLHPIAGHRRLYAQTALLGGFLGAWFLAHETVTRSVFITIRGLFRADVGARAEVNQRGASLTDIGASLPELFVKMFLVSAIFALLTVAYMVAANRRSLGITHELRGILAYFGAALVPLGALFVIYFLGTPAMSFRQIGFIMVLLTIVGAIAVRHVADWSGDVLPFGRTAVATGLAICLVLSLVTVFGSPYIYLPSSGIADQEATGFGTAFETRDETVPVAALSTQPTRYGDAYYGRTARGSINFTGSGDGLLEQDALNEGRLGDAYPGSTFHVALSESDVRTEIDVYRELNYEAAAIEAFETDRRVDRVMSNGEFDLYLVAGDEA